MIHSKTGSHSLANATKNATILRMYGSLLPVLHNALVSAFHGLTKNTAQFPVGSCKNTTPILQRWMKVLSELRRSQRNDWLFRVKTKSARGFTTIYTTIPSDFTSTPCRVVLGCTKRLVMPSLFMCNNTMLYQLRVTTSSNDFNFLSGLTPLSVQK